MASQIKMPLDLNMDLNAFVVGHFNYDDYTLENPIRLRNIESSYYENEQPSAKLNIELPTKIHLNSLLGI